MGSTSAFALQARRAQARARAEYLEAKEAVANLAAMDAGDPGLRANRMQLAGWLAQQLAS